MDTASQASSAIEIPVVDIAPFIARDPVRSRQVVEEVKRACESIGFLVLRGHQVPPALVEEVFSEQRGFFALETTSLMAGRVAHARSAHCSVTMALLGGHGANSVPCVPWAGAARGAVGAVHWW